MNALDFGDDIPEIVTVEIALYSNIGLTHCTVCRSVVLYIQSLHFRLNMNFQCDTGTVQMA